MEQKQLRIPEDKNHLFHIKKKKIVICIFILAMLLLIYGIYSVSVYFIRKNSPVLFQVSLADVKSVNIGCYPLLYDGDVTVTQEDVIQNLVSAVDNKRFSYWGTMNHRNIKVMGIFNICPKSGGYDSHFDFYNFQGEKIASFGFDGVCKGYTVQKNGLIYKLADDDTELNALCDELIARAENKEFPLAMKTPQRSFK